MRIRNQFVRVEGSDSAEGWRWVDGPCWWLGEAAEMSAIEGRCSESGCGRGMPRPYVRGWRKRGSAHAASIAANALGAHIWHTVRPAEADRVKPCPYIG